MFTLKDFQAAEIQTSGGIYGGAACATGAGSRTMSDGTVFSWSADTDHGDGSTTWHTVTDKSTAENQC